jgi:hypothetical protein
MLNTTGESFQRNVIDASREMLSYAPSAELVTSA